MTPHPTADSARAQPAPWPVHPRPSQDEDGFNAELTRIIAEAAELRAERDRIRSGEDERLAFREAASIRELIENGWPEVPRRTQPGRGNPVKGPVKVTR